MMKVLPLVVAAFGHAPCGRVVTTRHPAQRRRS